MGIIGTGSCPTVFDYCLTADCDHACHNCILEECLRKRSRCRGSTFVWNH